MNLDLPRSTAILNISVRMIIGLNGMSSLENLVDSVYASESRGP